MPNLRVATRHRILLKERNRKKNVVESTKPAVAPVVTNIQDQLETKRNETDERTKAMDAQTKPQYNDSDEIPQKAQGLTVYAKNPNHKKTGAGDKGTKAKELFQTFINKNTGAAFLEQKKFKGHMKVAAEGANKGAQYAQTQFDQKQKMETPVQDAPSDQQAP